jgi:hypothetical protein
MDDARHWPCETCQKKFSSSNAASNHMDARSHRHARQLATHQTASSVSSMPVSIPNPEIIETADENGHVQVYYDGFLNSMKRFV